MKIYGMTGGIGSGKSEAGRAFERRGIPVIDADRVGHAVIQPGGSAHEALLSAFGDGILAPDGRIDHAKVAARAFADPEARLRLNQITHPAIYAEIGRRCAEFAGQGIQNVIIEAALLAENGRLEPMFEALILVSSLVEERLRRLTVQRGMNPEEARRRIAAQTDPESKRPLAHWVIVNDGDLEHLQRQVDAIVENMSATP